MSRLQTAIQNYQSNNKGLLPSNYNTDFKNAYLLVGGDTFKDPDGSGYAFAWGTRGTIPTVRKSDILSDGANKIAASMVLEGGGVYCVNN
jgi:hypothetical protein